jgi:ABC-type glycerol-3-phosphate transport system substrate-binding protein
MTRRSFLAGSLATAGVALGSRRVASAAQSESIVYWTLLKPGDANPRARAETQIIENFTKKTGVRVQVEVIPWFELDRKLITATAANTGPDVSRTDPLRLPLHWAANSIVPLDQYFADWSQQERDDLVAWNYSVNEGKKWAFPISIVPYMQYYRKDLFDEQKLQPAKTWAEFAETTKKLTIPRQRWGFAMGLGRSSAFFVHTYFALVWSAGGEILDQKGKAVYNGEQGVKALQYVYDLVHTVGSMPAETVNYTYDEVNDTFKAGKLAVFFEGSHRYLATQAADAVKGKIGLAPMPSWDGKEPAPTTMTGWHIGIPRTSKKKDLAWEFIKHYTSKESALIQSGVAGEIPVRKSVLSDPIYAKPETAHIRIFGDYMNKTGRPVPKTVNWDQLVDGLLLAHHAVISKQKTPKQALDEAAAVFNAL